MQKYVMFRDASGLEFPILFPEILKHKDIADRLGYEVVSAGFVSLEGNPQGPELDVYVRGESLSLRIKSRPETDAKLIARYFSPD